MDDFMHSPIEDIVDYRACPDCSSPDEHLEHTLYDVQNSYTRLGELLYRKNKIIDKWEEGIHELALRYPESASDIKARAIPRLQWLRDENLRETALAERQRDEIITEIRKMEEHIEEEKKYSREDRQ